MTLHKLPVSGIVVDLAPIAAPLTTKILVRVNGRTEALELDDAAQLAKTGERVTVSCPECSDPMDVRRTLPQALAITNGRCEDCNLYAARRAAKIDRERRHAAFGEGRC